jgi:hypothetical protein
VLQSKIRNPSNRLMDDVTALGSGGVAVVEMARAAGNLDEHVGSGPQLCGGTIVAIQIQTTSITQKATATF